MPNVVNHDSRGKVEKKIKLADVPAGEVFRLPHYTYEEAVAGVEGAHFWLVIALVPKDAGRVSVVSSDGKEVRKFDADRLVVPHLTFWSIQRADMVDV